MLPEIHGPYEQAQLAFRAGKLIALFFDDDPSTNQYTGMAVRGTMGQRPVKFMADGGNYATGSVIRISVYDAKGTVSRRHFNPNDPNDQPFLARLAQQPVVPVYIYGRGGKLERHALTQVIGKRRNLSNLLAAANAHKPLIRSFDFDQARMDFLRDVPSDISFASLG